MCLKLIESKQWEYYIYQNNNGIQLQIPIPNPFPGFDVEYYLNKKEIKDYFDKGIVALKSRIDDMKVNYGDYKLIPWR